MTNFMWLIVAAMADRRLRVFHAVAKQLSFTRAAEALCMTQPAVTFQVRQLEEQFDARLFDRVQGRIMLTPAGQIAFEYAERILALSGEMEARLREMGSQLAGPLLVGASKTIAEFLLPRVLGEFKALNRGIVPRLFVENSEKVQEQVAARSLDVGFIEGDSHLASLACDVCCEDELLVVCAPAHPLARLTAAAPRSLAEHAYVSREPGSGTREVIDHYLQKTGVASDSLQVIMEASSPEALKGLVATGIGFTIMSRATVAKEVRLGDLVGVPLRPALMRQLAVVYPRERMHSRVVGGFIDFAKARLASLQGAPGDRRVA
jgi:DNA-binding transcriptional LysR family regulator